MRLKIHITGLVQGVGFRPFVSRLANDLGLCGYVLNNTSGVLIEAEGDHATLNQFLLRIEQEKPAVSRIYSMQHSYLTDAGFSTFEIRESSEEGTKRASILPDIAVCTDCLNEVTNPKDRRFLYPFINCTHCGPRFTIINALPYDRKNTSMRDFHMCVSCTAEYNHAADRRFHAQPDACHDCGPWISLYDCDGNLVCERDAALEKSVSLIRKGSVIAVRGIGGFHLFCDATSGEVVNRLRERKNREEKPMAVMFPDLASIRKEAELGPLEERAITSVERPIVIVRKKGETSLADAVSPDNSTVGVFLPYTPLHHLMMRKLRLPVIATSANLSDEPIVKDEKDAFPRLSKIADYILSHNRDIVRRCDDSVVRVMAGRQIPIRRSRGFAPLAVMVPFRFKRPVLALGPYMNNTIAVGLDDKVYLSQHIGDLDTPLAVEFYEETVRDFIRLLDVKPEIVVSDLHPGYYTTRFGEKHFGSRLIKIQHHYAHILSCMADNDLVDNEEVIGFAFDGTGYGLDKTIWGSEVLIASYRHCRRMFHLRPYRLPGGDSAVREPCRTALSLLYETFGDEAAGIRQEALSEKERLFFLEMIRKGVNSPVTTSMGRLFDGVASLIGLKHRVSYHAQAAIALEQAAVESDTTDSYPFLLKNNIMYQIPVIEGIVQDLNAGLAPADIAKKFHNTVVEMILAVSESLRQETGMTTVALSGGVFQNAIILEHSFERLKERGFVPLIHQAVPPNDGGVALGQAVFGHFHDR